MNVIFPTYIPISFSYTKRPVYNTLIKRSAARREYRATYWPASPLWEIVFPYKALTEEDLAALVGFQALVRGALHNFYFRDLKNEVQGQILTPLNEEATQFQLSRIWNYWYTEYPAFPPFVTGYGEGGQDLGGQGYGVPVWETPYLYLDGVEVDSGYTISQSGLVTFAASQTGHEVTASYGFYYKCRFKEDYADFELFSPKYWNARDITLVTVDD